MLGGETRVIGAETVQVLEFDASNNVLKATGLTKPTDGTSGYAKGCTFIDTDVVTGTTGVYTNDGTTTSCAFKALGTVNAGSVALASLATGIRPSHVVKYAGTVTWSGSGASLATTVTGVAATDIVVASFLVSPTQAAYIAKIVPTTNTITTTLSTANTSNDAQVSYVVYRAAA
jgi:hypothetical protein